MKQKIIAIALFGFTAAAVAFYPAKEAAQTPGNALATPRIQPNVQPIVQQRPSIEVVFALDTTGSMGRLIAAAKEKIWSIASTMATAQNSPEIKIGLVAYRDRGDAYVTRRVDLSADLDTVYAKLMEFQAAGGGDGPESVNRALYEAVHNMSWSQNANTYKVVFLVGDAPPHTDYPDEVQYPQILAAATQAGVVVNSIQAGRNGTTTRSWQQIAMLGGGEFLQVGQAGSAVATVTPYDKSMAELSAELDKTRVVYGDEDTLARAEEKRSATKKLHTEASVASRARRAAFNATDSGKSNSLGEKDLVADVASGRTTLDEVKASELPATVRAMAPAEQRVFVRDVAQKRERIQAQIKDLAGKRQAYIEKEVAEKGGAKSSLDHKLFGVIRKQSESKGLSYESSSVAY